jgi:hypothetical protein
MEMYAVATSESAGHYIRDVASLVRRHGLTPNIGSTTDDKGHTLRVLEAKGRWLRLWSQNMPLSGNEDPAACGKPAEAHPDPGQFIISIDPALPLVGQFVGETRRRAAARASPTRLRGA